MKVQGFITKVEKRNTKKGKEFQKINFINPEFSEVLGLCYYGNATLVPDTKKLVDIDIRIVGNPLLVAEFNEPVESKERKPLTSVKV